MADRMNLARQNEELDRHDRLVNEVRDLLKDIEKLAADGLNEKIRLCEKGMSPTNQPTYFPIAFRSSAAKNLTDQVFGKALGLIRDELLEKMVQRYNDAIEQLNRNGDSTFSKII